MNLHIFGTWTSKEENSLLKNVRALDSLAIYKTIELFSPMRPQLVVNKVLIRLVARNAPYFERLNISWALYLITVRPFILQDVWYRHLKIRYQIDQRQKCLSSKRWPLLSSSNRRFKFHDSLNNLKNGNSQRIQTFRHSPTTPQHLPSPRQL